MGRTSSWARRAPHGRALVLAIGTLAVAAVSMLTGIAARTHPPRARLEALPRPHLPVKRPHRPRRRVPSSKSTAPAAAVTTSASPIVAVIDGGVDVAHPALRDHLWTNSGEIAGNGRDDDGDGIVDDVNGANLLAHTGDVRDESGHGTHVSGIVLSEDPKAQIMVLKAGSGEFVDLGAATQAVYYAVAHGARIINMSWAFLDADAALDQAIRYAEAHNVLVVAAAGNFGTSNDLRPVYPAGYTPGALIGVAATCDGQTLAPFSDYGKASVTLAAPGCDITSTLPGGGYGVLSGTSMAAPAVAGAAARLLESDPGASAQDLRRALLGGAQPEPALSDTVASGAVLSVAGSGHALASPDTRPPAAFAATSPSGTFTVARDPSYYYGTVTFSWTRSADADLAGYRIVVDGADTASTGPGATSATVKVAPGTHSWSVVAFDRSGNGTTAAG